MSSDSELTRSDAKQPIADKLDMEWINSLPQPFMGRMLGDNQYWPVIDFEVGSGLIHIDVCGKSQLTHISNFGSFKDGDGVERSSDAFYSDATAEDREAL